jgi:LPXTG-motif cell wall-anchored protein
MSRLAAFVSVLLLAFSSAWAQTPAPGSPPATGPAATGQTGGIGDYWWIIVLVIIVAAAIWYFSRRNRSV